MKSILLVDEEAMICVELERTLQDFGFCVESAHTVESAVSLIQKKRFEVILLEFNLRSERNAHPRTGNGLQLVRHLRDLELKIPILMFTAMDGELYKTASLDAGADDFIPKSTSIPCLVARLRAHICR
jgi:DNA-binding response OmpR family regulator